MPKISAKVLYAIVGAGAVGSVSTGLYFGLGNSLTTNSSSVQAGGAEATSSSQLNVSYGREGKQCQMENVSGGALDEDTMKKLREELTDDVCKQGQ